MATDFYASWDADLNADTPVISPSGNTNTIQDSAKAVGGSGGSIRPSSAATSILVYSGTNDFKVASIDEGEISFWFLLTGSSARYDITWRPTGTSASQIFFLIQTIPFGGWPSIQVRLRDDADVERVFLTGNGSGVSVNTWYRIKLTWLWNDAGGFSAVYFGTEGDLENEELIDTDTGGNNFSRVAALQQASLRLDIATLGAPNNKQWLDEFLFGEVPGGRVLTLGAHLGIANRLGR